MPTHISYFMATRRIEEVCHGPVRLYARSTVLYQYRNLCIMRINSMKQNVEKHGKTWNSERFTSTVFLCNFVPFQFTMIPITPFLRVYDASCHSQSHEPWWSRTWNNVEWNIWIDHKDNDFYHLHGYMVYWEGLPRHCSGVYEECHTVSVSESSYFEEQHNETERGKTWKNVEFRILSHFIHQHYC